MQETGSNRSERPLLITAIIAIAATIGISKYAPNKNTGAPFLTDEDQKEIENTRERLIRIFGILGEIKPEKEPTSEDHSVTELLRFPNGKIDQVGTIRDCVEQTGTFTCSGSDADTRCTFKDPSKGGRSIGVHSFSWYIHEIEIRGLGEPGIKYDIEKDFTDDDYLDTLELACRDTVALLLSTPSPDKKTCDDQPGQECWNPGLLEEELAEAGRQIESETERIAGTLADYGFKVTDMGGNMLEIESDQGSIQLYGSPLIDRVYDDEERLIGATPIGTISFLAGCRKGETDNIIAETDILTEGVGGFSHFYGSTGCYGEDQGTYRMP